MEEQTKGAAKKQVIIEYTDEADLKKKLKEHQKTLVGSLSVDVFRPIALSWEDVSGITGKFYSEEQMQKQVGFGRAAKPLRFIYREQDAFITRNGKKHLINVTSDTVAATIRQLTLQTFGVTQNKHLSPSQLELVRDIYTIYKDIFLALYEKRLTYLQQRVQFQEETNEGNN